MTLHSIAVIKLHELHLSIFTYDWVAKWLCLISLGVPFPENRFTWKYVSLPYFTRKYWSSVPQRNLPQFLELPLVLVDLVNLALPEKKINFFYSSINIRVTLPFFWQKHLKRKYKMAQKITIFKIGYS